MAYSNLPEATKPSLSGKEYWLWRLARARIEELSWIARRMVNANHIVDSYYKTPDLWRQNIPRAKVVASNIRGENYTPAICVHGILPRCGSNIVHDIIETHPDVVGRSIGLSEFPLLCNSRSMDAFFASVVARHREVANNVTGVEMMSFLVSGWLRDLQERIGNDRTALLKMPSVQHLDLFPALFPRDKLVVVIRDGRDIVQSTTDTWKGARRFLKNDVAIAREYAASADVIQECLSQHGPENNPNIYVFRYEDYISNPHESIKSLFNFLELDIDDNAVQVATDLPVRGASSIKVDGRASWVPIEKPKNFSTSSKWTHWDHRKKKRFAKIAQKALVDLGYESSEEWVRASPKPSE